MTQLGVWISISRRVSFTYQNGSQVFAARQIPSHCDYSRAVTPHDGCAGAGSQVPLVMGSKNSGAEARLAPTQRKCIRVISTAGVDLA